MADFEQALAFTSLNEKGYANNPSDPGGETYRGVARKFWPHWSGWQIVDAKRSDPAFPGVLDYEESLQDLVKSFYRNNFWRFDGLKSQAVANKVFDMGVQDSLERSIKILQGSLRAGPGIVASQSIAVDGQYGPVTEQEANAADETALLLELRAQMALYYCSRNNPAFLKGWMRRAVR